eukprot:TRINITY_DN2081_c0_g2_i1.p1 TRINITY_DN2081_c0_g2~~TRINITY_DN2081_c0_g2_i1.p1  ORF type:complete len:863 (-),score=176.10 TRINITY_DN2081_c0_g2_i1:33-2621(-)
MRNLLIFLALVWLLPLIFALDCDTFNEGSVHEIYSSIAGTGSCGAAQVGDPYTPAVDFGVLDLQLKLNVPALVISESDTSAIFKGVLVGFSDPTIEFEFQMSLSSQTCAQTALYLLPDSCYSDGSVDYRDSWTYFSRVTGVFIASSGSKYAGARISVVEDTPFQFGKGGNAFNLDLGGRLHFRWEVISCDINNYLCYCTPEPTSPPTTSPPFSVPPTECPDILVPPTAATDPFEDCFPIRDMKRVLREPPLKRGITACHLAGNGTVAVSYLPCPVPRTPVDSRSNGVAGVNINTVKVGTNALGDIILTEYNPVVRNKANALGIPPETTVGVPVGYFSIGFGGQFIVTMASPFKSKLYLYELTFGSFSKCDFIEAVKVEVSDKTTDDAVWYDLGVYSNIDTIKPVTCADRNRTDVQFDDIAVIELDLDALISDPNAPECFLYIRLTDRSNATTFLRTTRPDTNADSFDLVGAVSTHSCSCTDLCVENYPVLSDRTIYGTELWVDETKLGLRQDGQPVEASSRLPDSPLGLPDDSTNTSNPNADAYALGFSGQVIIEMSQWFSPHRMTLYGSSPINQCDPRLGTTAVVEVAQNIDGPYFYLAYRNTFTACIPSMTAPHIRSLPISFTPTQLNRLWGSAHPQCFKYVRIIDRTNPSVWEGVDSNASGFHINAVTADFSCDCIEFKIPSPPLNLYSAPPVMDTPSDTTNDPDFDCPRTDLEFRFYGVFAKQILLFDIISNVLYTYRNHANNHFVRVPPSFYEAKIVTTKAYNLGTIPVKCGQMNIVQGIVANLCIQPPAGTNLNVVQISDDEGNRVATWSNLSELRCEIVIKGIYEVIARKGSRTDNIRVSVFEDTTVSSFPNISQ